MDRSGRGLMRTALLCLLLLPFSAATPGAPAPLPRPLPPNLLVNGSFEEGPPIGNWLPLAAGNKNIKGWVVTRESVDLIGNYWPAAHGGRSIDLHGSPGYGGISQTFATVAGRSYLVTFSLAGNPEGTAPKKVLGVSAAGQSGTFHFDTTGKTARALGWQKQTWR